MKYKNMTKEEIRFWGSIQGKEKKVVVIKPNEEIESDKPIEMIGLKEIKSKKSIKISSGGI